MTERIFFQPAGDNAAPQDSVEVYKQASEAKGDQTEDVVFAPEQPKQPVVKQRQHADGRDADLGPNLYGARGKRRPKSL